MTDTFPDQYSKTRIFSLSAVGSLLLHGLLVVGLSYLPNSQIVKNETLTVQLTLLPAAQVGQAKPTSATARQPRASKQEVLPPPRTPTEINRSQPPVTTTRSLLTRPPIVKSPAITPEPAKPLLKETSASPAVKTRNMMKMRVPAQDQQSSLSLPAMSTRQNAANRVMPPIPPVRKERSKARFMPTPPTLGKPQTLTATPPSPSGSTMTRPAILSSSRPVYPRVARESGWEGTVIVRTLIDTNGVPSQVNIRKSCGHPVLDQAAQDAVKNWTFQPAKDGNIPITKWVDIPIKFDLNS